MGRKKPKTFFDESLNRNMQSYGQYLMLLTELSISMFDWQGLPESINQRYLELLLFNRGSCVFFEDKDLDLASLGLPDNAKGIQADDSAPDEEPVNIDNRIFLALAVTNEATLNVYGEPVNFRAYAVNGMQWKLRPNDGVIIYNNMLHSNSVMIAEIYARRLYNLDQIIDVNTNAQKTPVLITCDEQQRLTLLNLYKEFDGNAPVIFGSKNIDINQLKALTTDAPYVADKLYQLKTQYWNEALTYLGISNVSFQKKERMVQDEVIRSQGGTIASRYSRLQSRRWACDKINKMFGLNVTCDFREDYRETDDEMMIEGETGHENDVDILATDFRTN